MLKKLCKLVDIEPKIGYYNMKAWDRVDNRELGFSVAPLYGETVDDMIQRLQKHWEAKQKHWNIISYSPVYVNFEGNVLFWYKILDLFVKHGIFSMTVYDDIYECSLCLNNEFLRASGKTLYKVLIDMCIEVCTKTDNKELEDKIKSVILWCFKQIEV